MQNLPAVRKAQAAIDGRQAGNIQAHRAHGAVCIRGKGAYGIGIGTQVGQAQQKSLSTVFLFLALGVKALFLPRNVGNQHGCQGCILQVFPGILDAEEPGHPLIVFQGKHSQTPWLPLLAGSRGSHVSG